jgi:hypothetical protein
MTDRPEFVAQLQEAPVGARLVPPRGFDGLPFTKGADGRWWPESGPLVHVPANASDLSVLRTVGYSVRI